VYYNPEVVRSLCAVYCALVAGACKSYQSQYHIAQITQAILMANDSCKSVKGLSTSAQLLKLLPVFRHRTWKFLIDILQTQIIYHLQRRPFSSILLQMLFIEDAKTWIHRFARSLPLPTATTHGDNSSSFCAICALTHELRFNEQFLQTTDKPMCCKHELVRSVCVLVAGACVLVWQTVPYSTNHTFAFNGKRLLQVNKGIKRKRTV
jgi:hypothetical protein